MVGRRFNQGMQDAQTLDAGGSNSSHWRGVPGGRG